MFKFKLEKILGVKEKLEEAKKNEYAAVNKKYDALVNKKNQLIEKKDGLVNEMKSLCTSIEGIKQMGEYNKYISYMKSVIVKVENNIEIVRGQKENKRRELEEAVKERKILEKFKEKEFEKYKKEQLIKENNLLNEIVSYRYKSKEEEE